MVPEVSGDGPPMALEVPEYEPMVPEASVYEPMAIDAAEYEPMESEVSVYGSAVAPDVSEYETPIEALLRIAYGSVLARKRAADGNAVA